MRRAAGSAKPSPAGTAAVVTPIGTVRSVDGDFSIGSSSTGGGGAGEMTLKLRTALVDIQRGLAPDPHGWVEKLF